MEDYILDKGTIKEWVRKLDNNDYDIDSEISDFMKEKIEKYLEKAKVQNDATVSVDDLWNDGTADEFRDILRTAADENGDIYLEDYFDELMERIMYN